MLEHMKLEGVGPAESFGIAFSERMNFLTGDNGLGKTLFLDVACWGLTYSMTGGDLRPIADYPKPKVDWQYDEQTRRCRFNRKLDRWGREGSSSPPHSLTLYSTLDGGFSLWDPRRNSWGDEENHFRKHNIFTFAERDIWEGTDFCEGLFRDWATWQLEDGVAFEQLKRVLEALSPSPDEMLVPGQLRRVSINDPKKYPTLKMPYGQEVPVIHASAGMRRILALAYLLVWTWQEHLAASELTGNDPAREIIFLIDEVEAHLHPQWQRRIVPALLAVMEALTDTQDVTTQLICSTHSPLILASVETAFDPEKDAIFTLDMEDGEVQLERFDWHKKGDANSWLTSTVFDLAQLRSLEAERAIEDAFALLRQEIPDLDEITTVDEALAKALPTMDPFFIRWSAFVDRARGVED